MAGVSNVGADCNWTGHPFDQANWYAFGRMAWNYELTSEQIADEWIRMTFSNDDDVVRKMESIMLPSRETVVNYMDPLGLNMIFGYDFHYGPVPGLTTLLIKIGIPLITTGPTASVSVLTGRKQGATR